MSEPIFHSCIGSTAPSPLDMIHRIATLECELRQEKEQRIAMLHTNQYLVQQLVSIQAGPFLHVELAQGLRLVRDENTKLKAYFSTNTHQSLDRTDAIDAEMCDHTHITALVDQDQFTTPDSFDSYPTLSPITDSSVTPASSFDTGDIRRKFCQKPTSPVVLLNSQSKTHLRNRLIDASSPKDLGLGILGEGRHDPARVEKRFEPMTNMSCTVDNTRTSPEWQSRSETIRQAEFPMRSRAFEAQSQQCRATRPSAHAEWRAFTAQDVQEDRQHAYSKEADDLISFDDKDKHLSNSEEASRAGMLRKEEPLQMISTMVPKPCNQQSQAVFNSPEDIANTRSLLMHRPNSGDKDVYRSVLITNIPSSTTLSTVLSAVHFGPLVSATAVNTANIMGSNSVLLVFLYEASARIFVASTIRSPLSFEANAATIHAQEHSPQNKEERQEARVQIIPTPTHPVPRALLSAIIERQHTRCLVIHGLSIDISTTALMLVLTEQGTKINGIVACNRNQLGAVYMEFSSIVAAQKAQARMQFHAWFKRATISFGLDPCCGPFDRDGEAGGGCGSALHDSAETTCAVEEPGVESLPNGNKHHAIIEEAAIGSIREDAIADPIVGASGQLAEGPDPSLGSLPFLTEATAASVILRPQANAFIPCAS